MFDLQQDFEVEDFDVVPATNNIQMQKMKSSPLMIDTDFADIRNEIDDVGGRMPTEVHYESDSGDLDD